MQRGLVLAFLFFFSLSGHAQVDISSQMLLGSESSPAGAVQSGRYQIRNGNKLPPKMSKKSTT
jgi:hypothetical protein